MQAKATVIISTYNMPHWLEKVLWGYQNQDYPFIEIIIADDGSGEETRQLIERFQQENNQDINHLWHPDNGYQRQTILNKAIMASTTDYIIMTDGDCIPRSDFVSEHMKFREEGYFLSGGYHKIPMETSEAITKESVFSGECFSIDWLKSKGMKLSFKNNKLDAQGIKGRLLNTFTPTKSTFNNCNSSAWKEDLIAINGYDERMKYGGPDRELGERLMNNGIDGKQIRYSAICLHLDHPRGYKTPESLAKNLAIRKEVKQKNLTWTPYGIIKNEEAVHLIEEKS